MNNAQMANVPSGQHSVKQAIQLKKSMFRYNTDLDLEEVDAELERLASREFWILQWREPNLNCGTELN